MKFNWDAGKAKTNLKKHRVSLEEAVTAFYDPLAKSAADPDHLQEEDRFILIGHSQRNNLPFVVHVFRESADMIRIVSARKATKREKRDFEELSGGTHAG